MAAPYLEELEAAFRSGARDLNEAAEKVGISFESACLSFNNGLLKGYWRICIEENVTSYSNELLAGAIGRKIVDAKIVKSGNDAAHPAHILIELEGNASLRFGLQVRSLSGIGHTEFITQSKYEAFGWTLTFGSGIAAANVGLSLMTVGMPDPVPDPS